MLRNVREFWSSDSGATAIEYGLLAGLISIVILTALTALGTKLNAKFLNISSHLN